MSVRTLQIGFNRLTSLEDLDFLQFSSLRALELNDNRLTWLPETIFGLGTTLQELDVSNNQLYAMPPSFTQLTALNRFECGGNQWLNVTESLLVKRGRALQKHFACEVVPLRRMRVMFVGQPGVGKTTLVRTLTQCSSDSGKRRVVTPFYDASNLSIYQWSCRVAKGVRVDVTAWDVGQIDAIDVAHQFYVNDDTIVVVVFDLSQSVAAGRLHDWLTEIRARSPRTPVLLFGTHSDQLDEATASQKCGVVSRELGGYQHITHVAEVDARDVVIKIFVLCFSYRNKIFV